MTDGPDPLGKRALFWMPVESAAPHSQPSTGQAQSPRRARPLGKHALYTDAGVDRKAPAPPLSGHPMPDRGVFTVTCSACGQTSRIGLLDLLVLQFPFGLWFPGRTFDHKMTCPACRRRTWLSVTLFP